jgi:glycosyltransferase involved in cell wall biosynthesis
MQETDFKYEILINDDSSNDRTADIIREYEKKYPDLVKPFYHTDNQYSKGLKVEEFNRVRAAGKYIAVCEGDDYWINPFKLKIQVEFLEKHPEYSCCFHAAHRVTSKKKKMMRHARPNIGNKIFTVEEIIKGSGALFAYSSIMYQKEKTEVMPSFYKEAPVEDYPLYIFLSFKGMVYYIDHFMSVHRLGSGGSWNTRMEESIDKREEYREQTIRMLKIVDKYSNYIYTEAIKERILNIQFNSILDKRRLDEINNEKYKTIYNNLGIIGKTKICIKQYFPWILKAWKKTKRLFIS